MAISEIDLQGCEHCSKEFPIEQMSRHEDVWICQECDAAFREHFKTCEHDWEPHVDAMGDDGQCCKKCSGFVRNEDFGLLGLASPADATLTGRQP